RSPRRHGARRFAVAAVRSALAPSAGGHEPRGQRPVLTTFLVRLPLLGTTLGLYAQTRDPVFLSLAAIVGVGMVLTTLGMLTDGRAARRPQLTIQARDSGAGGTRRGDIGETKGSEIANANG